MCTGPQLDAWLKEVEASHREAFEPSVTGIPHFLSARLRKNHKLPQIATAYTLGCNQGNFDRSFSPFVNSEVVLDFGSQLSDGSGAQMINGVTITNAQIEAVAEAFSQGYWICTGSDTTSYVRLGIGTNNAYNGGNNDVSYSGGQTWVNDVLPTECATSLLQESDIM